MTIATEILRAAAATIEQRGIERDRPGGERSMGRAVRAFNCLYGDELRQSGQLSEVMGWRLMEILKIARGEAPDDFLDGAAYAALAGEAAERATWSDVRQCPEDRG